jgi:hyperosmotically inducible protein
MPELFTGKQIVRTRDLSEHQASALLNRDTTSFDLEGDMKSSTKIEKGAGKTILMLILMLILVGGIYYAYSQSASLREAFHSVKESTQDATTTSRVRTALLLSKRVSPFDIKVETIQADVTLTGQVPSDEVKNVAGAIAQDTAGVKQVHNNLGINPTAERNPETERLGERVADLELKTVINDGLSKSAELQDKHIDVQVKNGIVNMGGTLDTSAQKYSAEQIAWQASGVRGVMNNISVTGASAAPETADEKIARRIEFELYSTRAISLKNMQINVNNGTATLTGDAGSRAERLLAEKIAQSVEGIRKVVNNLAAPDNQP